MGRGELRFEPFPEVAPGDKTKDQRKLNPKAFRFIYPDKEGKDVFFTVHLAKVGDVLLLDVQPAFDDVPDDPFFRHHLIQAHGHFMIDQIEPE